MSTAHPAHDVPGSIYSGSLALGAYLMALAVVFYVPLAMSPLAQQNDVFMTNFVLGLGAFVAGSGLVTMSGTREVAHRSWLIILLGALAGIVAFAGVLALGYGNAYASAAPVMACYGVIVLALGIIASVRGGHLIDWSRSLLLGLGGAGLVSLYYALLGGQYNDAYGPATYLPRFVDGQTSVLALLVGAGVFLLSHFWGRRQ